MNDYCPGKTSKRNGYFRRTFVITSILIIFALITSTFIITTPVFASELDDFETAATTDDSQPSSDDPKKDDPKKDDPEKYAPKNDDRKKRDHEESLSEQLFGNIFEVLFDCTIYLAYESAKMSCARVGGSTDIDSTKVELRQDGEPTLPYFQADYQYMHVSSEISARVGRIELGYGPFGFEFYNTDFTEISPKDNLTLNQYHLLLRMSANRSHEFGIGMGILDIRGNEENSGFSLTFPIKIYPKQSFGFKFKPTYSWINGNCISDQDLAVVFSKRFGTIELGYRFLEVGGKSLDGTYFGLAWHY